jgi:hypothetical protein
MQIERVIARGQLVPLVFMQDAAAASQTNAALTVTEVASAAGNVADGYTIPWDFEVIGVSVRVAVADARTAGTLTVEPLVNGSATGLTAALNATDTQGAKAIQARGSDQGAAGGKVGCRITTDSGWLPATADVVVTVWVLTYLEGI